jgi:Spy/CpxP family protein refolding chaperone
MKSIVKFSLAALLLGLPVSNLLRADDDQPAPVQSGPSIPPDQSQAPAPGGTPAHAGRFNPHRMLRMLTERLNLTNDQQAKILPLLQAQADQLGALHNDTSLSDDDKHQQMRAIMQTTRGQIRALLTPGQQPIFDTMRLGHGGPPPGGNPPPPANTPPPPPPADNSSSSQNPPPANPPPPADGPPPPSN